jgi:hypothetical protein
MMQTSAACIIEKESAEFAQRLADERGVSRNEIYGGILDGVPADLDLADKILGGTVNPLAHDDALRIPAIASSACVAFVRMATLLWWE